jgi:hypothetical protein
MGQPMKSSAIPANDPTGPFETGLSTQFEAPGTPADEGIVFCTDKDRLADIREPGTDLVIWQRTISPQLTDWLDHCDAVCLPHLRILVVPGDFRCAIEPLLDTNGLPRGNLRNRLVNDMGGLVSVYADITLCGLVDVRLESIDHDACWKFHRDNVEARLLTTYRGPATQWIQPPHAEQALREQQEFDGPVENLHLGDVAIFRGSSANPDEGIVHRSPRMAGTGASRLLLCLNRQSVTSPLPWNRQDQVESI